MQFVTLLIRTYHKSQLVMIRELLKSYLEGLDADLEVSEADPCSWVRINVSGEDEITAVNFLTREFGRCPEQLESVERFSTVQGRITKLGESHDEVSVDIGVFSPRMVEAKIPLPRLQGQLADGRKVALNKLIQLFGLCESLPLTVKVLNVYLVESHVEAMLARKQLVQYSGWTKSLLDRLLILGATQNEVESALKKTEFSRDIVSIESLGLLEHAVVCKLGTDAAGLIPKVGRLLPKTVFTVYNPRRIQEFLQ